MTLFEKIIARQIPAEIIFEDDDVLAFRDISPQAPTHVLIVPKRPIPSVDDLGENDALLVGKLVLTAKRIAAAEGLTNGYRLVMNCKADGGQTVDHLHLHLLGGRALGWPPG